QTKLAISRPDDPSEQEADRVAEQVMRMRDLAGENETAISGRADPHPIQRACSECDELLHRQKAEEEEEKPIHTKPLVSQITPLIQRQVEDEQNIVATTPLGQRIAEPEQEEDEEETVSPKLESGADLPVQHEEDEKDAEEEPVQAARQATTGGSMAA